MNINSYNITEVNYHYIGLRVLGGMGTVVGRDRQIETVSANVRKLVVDRALRLMLPEPRGTFQSVGEKICQELVHFGFAHAERGRPYELTDNGQVALALLDDKQFVELRRLMTRVHLQTYDNLRAVVQAHFDAGAIWQPVVSSAHIDKPDYLPGLLEPTFGQDAPKKLATALDGQPLPSAKKLEDILRTEVLKRMLPGRKMRVALFRSICDRLVSLRLLNKPRAVVKQCEFEKTYSPCVAENPLQPWYTPLQIALANGKAYQIYLCEPDATDPDYQATLLSAVDLAFSTLFPEGGYYDIPDLRDWVCEYLMIPEAAFDDGLNCLLDWQPPVLSAGLQYERITGRRRPLVRIRQSTLLHNLIRKV